MRCFSANEIGLIRSWVGQGHLAHVPTQLVNKMCLARPIGVVKGLGQCPPIMVGKRADPVLCFLFYVQENVINQFYINK